MLLERGITQRDLAFETNIDESRISKIIKGYDKPTSDMKDSICDYLGVEPEEIFPHL